jgi:SHAQKYF class myb-like DNA-binding protein
MMLGNAYLPSQLGRHSLPPICNLGIRCFETPYPFSAPSLTSGHLYSILEQQLLESSTVRPPDLNTCVLGQHTTLNEVLAYPSMRNSHEWNQLQRTLHDQFQSIPIGQFLQRPIYPCPDGTDQFDVRRDLTLPDLAIAQQSIRASDSPKKEAHKADTKQGSSAPSKRRRTDFGSEQRQPSPSQDKPVAAGATEAASQACRRTATVRWTRAEHEQFLEGLERFGVGQWCSIARHCVPTRSPTQVASHHQKFALRSNMPPERRHKASVLDETTPRVQSLIQASRTSSDASV